jgi:hypothetical protein
MDSKAVEGLTYQGILAISRLPFEPSTPISSGELTDGQGKAVDHSKGGVVRYRVQELAPYQFLDLPEVSRLTGESGAVHSFQRREKVSVVAAEIPVKGLVLTETQVFTHRFHSEHFGVRQAWHWSSLTQTMSAKCGLQNVINPAKSCYYKQVQAHHTPPREVDLSY